MSESTNPVPTHAGVAAHVALGQARARLSITAHMADAQRDAELLLRHITGLSRAEMLTHPDRLLSMYELEAFYQAIERRAQSEPIQYITGVQEFYGLEFHVTPAVLIPRPETEHLVEAALEIAGHHPSSLHILDVGTGSGAIAVSLAHQLPEATIVATDVSEAALEIARENAARHHTAGRIRFVHADLFPANLGCFDLICSNPPYIQSGESLDVQVSAFEPHSALFAGPRGLDIYHRLIPLAASALRTGASLLLEIGHGQRDSVESLLRASNLENVRFIPDLQDIPRIAIARKPARA